MVDGVFSYNHKRISLLTNSLTTLPLRSSAPPTPACLPSFLSHALPHRRPTNTDILALPQISLPRCSQSERFFRICRTRCSGCGAGCGATSCQQLAINSFPQYQMFRLLASATGCSWSSCSSWQASEGSTERKHDVAHLQLKA